MLPCVIVLTPLTHIYINRVCFDVRTSRGLTGVPSSGWLTHISRKFLTVALNLGRKLIKVGWWHDYLYQEATLCSESAPAYHWSRGTLVWGDEEMEIIFFWLGKTMLSLFPVDRRHQLANESGLPAAHLVTRPLCGWARRRGHCCFPALSLWLRVQTHIRFHMHKALIQFHAGQSKLLG